MPPKFKLKSTGGAGFSSQSNSQNQQSMTAGGSSFYEPASGSRRTPRRTLGNVLNNGNMPPQAPEIT
jgi:hypothetical protein